MNPRRHAEDFRAAAVACARSTCRARDGSASLLPGTATWDHADAEAWTPDELEIVLYRKDDLEGSEQTWPSDLPRPPVGAREPSRLPLGGRSETMIQQPIPYRVSGDREAALASTLPDPKGQDGVVWNGSTWPVRYERVVPARTWFW